MQCPKCGYTRQQNDNAPDYECPSCGIIYAKFGQFTAPTASTAKVRHPEGLNSNSQKIPCNTGICQSCETLGNIESNPRGHLWLEVLLWLCILVPGFCYTLWRRQARIHRCRACGSNNILPVGTPMGEEILARRHPAISIDQKLVAKPPAQKTWDILVATIFGLLSALSLVPALVLWSGWSSIAQLALSIGFGFIAVKIAKRKYDGLVGI